MVVEESFLGELSLQSTSPWPSYRKSDLARWFYSRWFYSGFQGWLSWKLGEHPGLPGSQQISYARSHVTKNPTLRILIWGLGRLSCGPVLPSSLTLSIQIKFTAAGSKLPAQPGPGEKAESLRDEQRAMLFTSRPQVLTEYLLCAWHPLRIRQWATQTRSLSFFPPTPLLRYNSHIIQFTYLKCTFQQFLV